MNIWIISDTHFNHKQLIVYGRPENFEKLIWSGLKQINSNDVLIHLGDICIGNNVEVHYHLNRLLQCRKILVRGNHDRKSNTWYLEHGWAFVCDRLDMTAFGKKIVFTHIPIKAENFDINIHGHFHDTDHRKHEPQYNKILGGHSKLFSLEYTNYKPILLKKFI